MDFKTHITHQLNEQIAVEELVAKLTTTNLVSLVCYFTQNYGADKLRKAFKHALPNVSIIGCSTCKGIMTERGVHFGSVLGVMAIYDSKSHAYGSALMTFDTQSESIEATKQAISIALDKANRTGEVPRFAIVHSTPGMEETLIKSIDSVFKTPVPLIGATAADNAIKGQWSVFTEDGATNKGLAIQLVFASKPLSTGFSCGYSPTEYTGLITKAVGREILEIDQQPAQDVYLDWIFQHSQIRVSEQFKFELVTRYPLGRIAGKLYEQPYFKLSHPVSATETGGILLFTDIQEGEQVTLMSGDKEQLIARPARVIKEAKRQAVENGHLAGAVCVICAGAMLYLDEDIEKVYATIKQEMGELPFICPFTFGEQGRFINGNNGHGNLMISSATFYSD
ncbi:histidine kinase [Vibrio sp. JPW-9-11-11]|uniref:FIST signal transduction protein n=1 Tax=Vibrio sp. JPW-9-11-11 TaxID=1416532 RepID=UPI001D6D533E|nr:FIST N-terminal domain-containing protein [Vibrio sp. JPW-9-11-11]NVD06652.1 histidine kinase [Vibrio sp. JPW-9-11-11]